MKRMKPNKVYRIRVSVTPEQKRELEKQLGRGNRGQAMWGALYAVVFLALMAAMVVAIIGNGARAYTQEAGEISREEQVTGKLEVPSAELLYAIEAMENTLPQQVGGDWEDPEEAEKIEAALVEQGYLRTDVPLDFTLQDVLRTECGIHGIPYAVALGLIEVESGFREDAVNPVSGCYGLCQLNPKWFPSGLTSVENIRTGLGYLEEQLERYGGDMAAALTAYNAGEDTGKREYAEKVLAAAERWREP